MSRILVTTKYIKKISHPIYYLAYGSNLNKEQIHKRCPGAEPIGTCILRNARLFFRVYADIIPYEDSSIQLGIWKIKKSHEKALDRYEGFPDYYEKTYWTIKEKNEIVPALIYFMNKSHRYYTHNGKTPTRSYFKTMLEGYNKLLSEKKATPINLDNLKEIVLSSEVKDQGSLF